MTSPVQAPSVTHLEPKLADHTLPPGLSEWNRNPAALQALFPGNAFERLEAARLAIDPEKRTAILVSYENPFAKGGGVIAVIDPLAHALKAHNSQTIIISPLHQSLTSSPKPDQIKPIGSVEIVFEGQSHTVEISECTSKGNRWVLFGSPEFFRADGGKTKTSPYIYGQEHASSAGSSEGMLMRDALFASKALPKVLAAIGLTENLIVHLHDWQVAPAALTIKESLLDGTLESAAVVLTSHNPYDNWLPEHKLALITERSAPHFWQGVGGDQGTRETVYQRMAPITDAILSTVSPEFAEELTRDPLQVGHFASHLQTTFRAQGITGIGHGLFGERREINSTEAVAAAGRGDFQLLLEEKVARRNAALDIIESYQHPDIIGSLTNPDGGSLAQLDPSIPVFMMFGRLDPGQKGFDLLSSAIQKMGDVPAKFFITPNLQGDVRPFIDQFREIAEAKRGDVVIFPFLMQRGYMEVMRGASWAIMPSFYEPFGAATEPYISGTPVVARATGGLKSQTIDFDLDREKGSGFLFREHVPQGSDQAHDWRRIQHASTPLERLSVPLYGEMSGSLAVALMRAWALYRFQPEQYGKLLSNIPGRLDSFSWERSAQQYAAIYSQATH